MIVDVHAHVWDHAADLGPGAAERLTRAEHPAWARLSATQTDLDRGCAAADCVFVLGQVSQLREASVPVARIAAAVKGQPGRYLGFAGLDPLAGQAGDILDAVIDLELAGIVVSPGDSGFHPTHSRAMAAFERCQEHGLAVIVHPDSFALPHSRLEFAQPWLLDEVAQAFPRLAVLLCQIGHPWVEQGLALLAKHERVYADVSWLSSRRWLLYQALRAAHEMGVADKLLLGSDFPWSTPEQAVNDVMLAATVGGGSSGLPAVPRDLLRGIVDRDAIACLGLRPPRATGPAVSADGEDEPDAAAGAAEALRRAETESEGKS